MNDFDKATAMVGNRFDLVLIASERMRELHRQRRARVENGEPYNIGKKTPPEQAFSDIENGLVGREYLLKVRSRVRAGRKTKFDELK